MKKEHFNIRFRHHDGHVYHEPAYGYQKNVVANVKKRHDEDPSVAEADVHHIAASLGGGSPTSRGKVAHFKKAVKEDISPAAPTTAPNTSLGIKAGPIFIGKRNKDKNGKTGQGSQRPPMDTQIIMAGDNTDGELVEKIGHIEKGAFHKWLGKSEDKPITAADIQKGLKAGGHAAKMANFARNFAHIGESMKDRIKRTLHEGTTGATRMDLQKAYDHTFTHAPGWTVAQRTAHVEKHHQVKNVQVNSYGDVVNYKHLHEAHAHDDSVNVGDFIHAGFGTRGGAGLHGHVTKIDGNTFHIKGTDKIRTIGGALEHKTYKVHKKVVTLLKSGGLGEDVIVSMEDLAPILESYADWHDTMSKKGKEGSEVAFKIKNAGGRTEAHLGGKKIGHYDHTTRKGHMAEAHGYDVISAMAKAGRMHRPESHSDDEMRCQHCAQRTAHFEWKEGMSHSDAQSVASAEHMKAKSVKEDVIYEAGRASKNKMKRKYLGKTRGTTATGKAAHEVVIDPIIKTDDTKGKVRY